MIIIFLFISILVSQTVPFEMTSIKSEIQDRYNTINISDSMIDFELDISLVERANISIIDKDIYNEIEISIYTLKTIRMEISHTELPVGSKFFLIDLDKENIIVGPFYTQKNLDTIDLGPIYSSNFIIQ